MVGEGRVREKLGTGGGGEGRAPFLPFDDVDPCCSTLLVVALAVGVAAAAVSLAEAAEGMTRWRVGARPRVLQNSRTVTWSPVALIRPEVKTTPDWRSAKTGSALSATEVLLTTVREDCDVRVSGSGLGVPPVNWSPRVTPGREVVVRGRGDSDALCTRRDTVNVRSGVGELESAEGGLTLSFRYTFKSLSG